MILDNAFLHPRDCVPCAFILLSSFIAFSLKPLYRRKLQAVLKNSPTRAKENVDLGMIPLVNSKNGKTLRLLKSLQTNTPSFTVVSMFKKVVWVPEYSTFSCNLGGIDKFKISLNTSPHPHH